MKRLSKSTLQVLVAGLAGHNRLLVEAFFSTGTSSNSFGSSTANRGSKSVMPILDEFVHGSTVYPALSIEEIINSYG